MILQIIVAEVILGFVPYKVSRIVWRMAAVVILALTMKARVR